MFAAAIAAGLAAAATPAAAYTSWFWPAPAVVAQPDPHTTKPVKRRTKRHEMQRKLAAEKIRDHEKTPAGPLHIIISIKQQRMTLYANGKPFAHSPVSTGVPGHPTPQGVFSVIQKEIYHESNLYSAAPMPYMQRITWSGVAMHQGVVPGHPASHGCIRLPAAFAQRLWRITKVGARVIIAQDDVALADIESPRLLAMAPASKVSAQAPAAKIRLANVAAMSDTPLKGTIDAGANGGNDESRVESAIDRIVQEGMAEADAYLEDEEKAALAPEKPALAETPKDPVLRPGPISVYVSRKTGRIYVRKGFDEVFDAPVTIAQPDQPLGTHVFTALEDTNAFLHWIVASLPTERVVKKGKYLMTTTARGEKLRKELSPPEYEATPPGNASEALDRITIPDETLARITELMSAGASLIVSDLAYSYETGRGTDFIVLTR